VNRTGSTDTPFLYNGQDGVITDENGLYYMRARYYNPDIKRFVNLDVLLGSIDSGQSLNRYAYVNGNPVLYTDPYGLFGFGLELIETTEMGGGQQGNFKMGTNWKCRSRVFLWQPSN
jgi:RHS repeat-associated protein